MRVRGVLMGLRWRATLLVCVVMVLRLLLLLFLLFEGGQVRRVIMVGFGLFSCFWKSSNVSC
jgi:hypothetical protein